MRTCLLIFLQLSKNAAAFPYYFMIIAVIQFSAPAFNTGDRVRTDSSSALDPTKAAAFIVVAAGTTLLLVLNSPRGTTLNGATVPAIGVNDTL